MKNPRKKTIIIKSIIVIGVFRFLTIYNPTEQSVGEYAFQDRLSRVRARIRFGPQMLISQLLLFTTTLKPFGRESGTQFGNGEILMTPVHGTNRYSQDVAAREEQLDLNAVSEIKKSSVTKSILNNSKINYNKFITESLSFNKTLIKKRYRIFVNKIILVIFSVTILNLVSTEKRARNVVS